MIHLQRGIVRLGRRLRARFFLVPVTLAGLLCTSVSGYAIGVPKNLGNGLDRLVASNLALQAESVRQGSPATGQFQGFATKEAASTAKLSVRDGANRLLVRIPLNGDRTLAEVRKAALAAAPSLKITAEDARYRAGIIEGFVSIDDVPRLASAAGVRSVIMGIAPVTRMTGRLQAPRVEQAATPGATAGETINQLGTCTDQGVFYHRVDQINKLYNPVASSDFQGTGLSIACISNSFAANTSHPASLDVTNFDLPGDAGNPAGNTTPVFVLQDDTSSSSSDDEGRGMCQIVYKMAPKAKVGFATANLGEVSFANNIRGLAGIAGFTVSGQTFAADVICDDVAYFDEPFYSDGIISGGIEDAAAAGVSYFSSAGNDPGTHAYESVIRLVPPGTGMTAAAGNTSLAGTNIDLTGVDPSLYAGGFHNFNPKGLDVAQTVNVAANNSVATILQWNDPFDHPGSFVLGAQVYAGSGTYVSSPVVFDASSTPPLPPFTAGQAYQIVETATSGNFDAIVSVIAPDGSTVVTQDTGVDETVSFTASATGQYKISINHFASTTGSFNLTVHQVTINQFITSDWNLLAFRTDTGAYVPASSLTTDNLSSNEPVEIGFVNRTSLAIKTIQYVLARANATTPTGFVVADHIRYTLAANGGSGYGPAEYFAYNAPATAGHEISKHCNGAAAYSVFRPNLPEDFTSPGPGTIYFDQNENRLSKPDVRLEPSVAAADAANVSANEGAAGLGNDAHSDVDTAPNFSGTSAAAPHAAACALLALQAHGGRHSLTPAQMTTLLHQSAFPHDLDPNAATGSARAGSGKIALTFTSNNESDPGTGLNDANSLAVSYVGPGYIKTLVFNPAGTAATGGNVTGGNNGLDVDQKYFSNIYPGLAFLTGGTVFTPGTGIAAGDVTANYSHLAPAPSNGTSQYWTLGLTFANGKFTGGKALRFTISRGVQHNAYQDGTVPGAGPTGGATQASYSADLFGGGVLIPEGTVINPGMAFSGTLGDGTPFNGTMRNLIGQGYSKLDGFGFINAQTAVAQPAP